MRMTEQGDVRWSDRVPQVMIRRLYESDASGFAYPELLEDVGFALYARVRDILYIADFLGGVFRCPRCEAAQGRGPVMGEAGAACACPACGFTMTREALCKSFHKKQLNPGGAVSAFEKFVGDWERASTAQQKMLAIDAVIHAFHYSLKAMPHMPTRAAGVNLIEGRLTEVVAFLDGLSANDEFQKELARNRALINGWKNQPL